MTYKIKAKTTQIEPSSPRSMGETPVAVPVVPGTARYIRLGVKGELAKACTEAGMLRLGFTRAPHDACQAGDWEAVRRALIVAGRAPRVASNQTSQLRDFYSLGADALWVTFEGGLLWWAFAEPGVEWDKPSGAPLPRIRRTRGPWRCTDIHGQEIRMRDLSTRLTRLAGFRGTVCDVEERDYLVRRINGEDEPMIQRAAALQEDLIASARELISALHWRDFEILVDRIFADSGWRRVGLLGETQADADLVVEQVATGERAFIQVKSRANPAVLDDYIERFETFADCDRMFFICHSPTKALAARASQPGVELWFESELAEKAIRAGLFSWLIARNR